MHLCYDISEILYYFILLSLYSIFKLHVLILPIFQKFNAAANSVRNMKNRPSDSELLELYALYKQATTGDCSIGMLIHIYAKIILRKI